MSRIPRIFYNGAVYHVYQRGNNKDYIFENPNAKNFFLKELRDFNKKYDFELFAYAIMNNHYHLLIKTNNDTLDKIMFSLNNNVAKYISRTSGRCGHIYGDRYSSILVKDEHYLLSLIRYIHKNPLRANLCTDLSEYIWCSHKNYVTSRNHKNSPPINKKYILNILGPDRISSHKKYLELMGTEGTEDDLTLDLEVTKELMKDKNLSEFKTTPFISPDNFAPPSLSDIYDSTITDLSAKRLIKNASKSHSLTEIKLQFIKEALYYKYTFVEMAEFLQITPGALSKFTNYHNIKNNVIND